MASNYDKRFERLFKDILYKAEQAKFVLVFKMKFWLKYLTDNPHHADINELLK